MVETNENEDEQNEPELMSSEEVEQLDESDVATPNDFGGDVPDELDDLEAEWSDVELPDDGDGDDAAEDTGDGDDDGEFVEEEFQAVIDANDHIRSVDDDGVLYDENGDAVTVSAVIGFDSGDPNLHARNVYEVREYVNALYTVGVERMSDFAGIDEDDLDEILDSAITITGRSEDTVLGDLLKATDFFDDADGDADAPDGIEDVRSILRGKLTADDDDIPVVELDDEVLSSVSVSGLNEVGVTSCRDIVDYPVAELALDLIEFDDDWIDRLPVDVAEDLCTVASELPDVDVDLEGVETAGLRWKQVEMLNGLIGEDGKTGKKDLRVEVIRALEAETDWLSIKERCEEGNHTHLSYWDHEEEKWKNDSWDFIGDRINEHATKEFSDSFTASVKSQLGIRHRVEKDEVNGGMLDETVIPVANGYIKVDDIEYDPETMTIDPDSVELHEIEKEHRFLNRIETEWDPDGADLDGFDTWNESLVPDREDDLRVMMEWVGHALHPDYPADGWLVLIGDGQSGKSQFLDTITAMIGDDNCSALSLHQLQNQRFSTELLANAIVNVHTELNGDTLKNINTLKALTAGETVKMEKKGVQPFFERNNTSMLFASDDPPALDVADNDALKRRLYPVEFPCSFKWDPDANNPYHLRKLPKLAMDDLLRSEARLKAALIRGIEGLARLINEGRFTSNLSKEERYRRYQAYADPIKHFGFRALEPAGEDSMISNHVMSVLYERFAELNDHPPKSIESITGVIKDTDLPVTKGQSRSWSDGSSQETVFRGVKPSKYAIRKLIDPEEDDWYYRLDDSALHEDDERGATGEDSSPTGITEQTVEADGVETLRGAVRKIVTDPDVQDKHGYVEEDVIRAELEERFGKNPRDEVLKNAVENLMDRGDIFIPAGKFETGDRYKAI